MSRPFGFHHTEETKLRMITNHSQWNENLTKETDERVRNQSNSLKEYWKNNPRPRGMFGKNHSDETKRKMALKKQGKDNGNWKGGVTESVRLFRKSRRYQQWRKEVLQRDNFACQFCAKINCSIAHHLKSIKEYPELRFDVDNGRTICKECHIQIHKRGVFN